MKTRLLGAAVLIALAVLFVPMFFSSKPPAPGGDQSVNLAIPQSPDRNLQTRTMSLTPDGAPGAPTSAATSTPTVNATPGQPLAPGDTPVSGDQLATVNIGSARPRDVETDPQAGKPPVPTTVTTGSGASPTQPVIPMQAPATVNPPVIKPQTVVATPTVAAPKPAPAPVVVPAAPVEAPSAAIGHGSYALNLSAYASAAGAANLERQVRGLGYPVHSRVIQQAGQPRTLVTAGPFETRTAAEAARLKITQSIPGVPARLERDASHEGSAAVAGKSVAAATPAAASAKPGGWAVQLAAMSSQGDANALRDKLRANGFDGFVDSVQSGGKQLWRVRAGPQTQRADAVRVHDQIKAKLGVDGNVVSVP